MLKEYRLRKLNEKLEEYKAKYNESGEIFSGVTEIPQYYIDKRIEYAGIIAVLEKRIKTI